MSKLRRPLFFGPCLFCAVFGAMYIVGSASNQALADKQSKGGLPAVIERVDTLEDALGIAFSELDSQRALFNAFNFSVNVRLNELERRVTALEGGGGDPIP